MLLAKNLNLNDKPSCHPLSNFVFVETPEFFWHIESVSGALTEEQIVLGIGKTNIGCPYLCAEAGNRKC